MTSSGKSVAQLGDGVAHLVQPAGVGVHGAGYGSGQQVGLQNQSLSTESADSCGESWRRCGVPWSLVGFPKEVRIMAINGWSRIDSGQ